MGQAEKITDMPETVEVKSVNEKSLSSQTGKFVEAAESMVVEQVGLQYASDQLAACKTAQKQLAEQEKELIKPLQDHVAFLKSKFTPYKDKLVQAEGILRGKIKDFQIALEKKQAEEEAKARDKLEKEKQRLAAKAEKLREQGKDALADEIDFQCLTAVPVVPAQAQTKAKGLSSSKKWKAEVVDIQLLCKEIAEGRVPVDVIKDFNKTALNSLATLWKDKKEVPGLRIFQDIQLTSRAR